MATRVRPPVVHSGEDAGQNRFNQEVLATLRQIAAALAALQTSLTALEARVTALEP